MTVPITGTALTRSRVAVALSNSSRPSRRLRGLILLAQEHHRIDRLLLHPYSFHWAAADEAADGNAAAEIRRNSIGFMGYHVSFFPMFCIHNDIAPVVIETTDGQFHQIGDMTAARPDR